MSINLSFEKAKSFVKRKYKDIITSKKIRRTAYGMLPGVLILIMLTSYNFTVRSSAVTKENAEAINNYTNTELQNKINDVLEQESNSPSLISPIFEGFLEPLQNGIYIVDLVLQDLIHNAFKPGVTQIVKVENPTMGSAVFEYNEDDYNIESSKILSAIWIGGSYVGVFIAMITFLISLLIIIGGGAKQIKDNPFALLARFVAAMFVTLNSQVVISFVLSMFGKLWDGMNDLILTRLSMTNEDVIKNGLFCVATFGKNALLSMCGINILSGILAPIMMLVYLIVFIKMVVTFFKVFKSCVERYLTFMFTLTLMPLGVACFTSKMTQRVSATYLMFVFSEFVALVFDSITMHIIMYLTESGTLWMSIVNMIFYFALAKVAIQMDTFLSKMGFNVIATGSQLAKSVGGTAQTMMAMARTTMKGRERAGNVGAAMFKDGVAEGNLSKQQAGARLATIFGGRSKADFSRDAAINTMENHITSTQCKGEFAVAAVNGGGAMNTNEAARWMTQAVGANGTTYAPEMAQKGVSIADGDKMINMGSGDFQHLDKNGNIKSAIIDGDVYSRAELDKNPRAMAKVNDFNTQNDMNMPFTQEGMVCKNDTNGNVSSYDMLVNNGCSEARAREFESYLQSQQNVTKNNSGKTNIENKGGNINNKIAWTKGDGKGGFIARNSEGYIIGGMDKSGVKDMQTINKEIYATNAKKNGEFGSIIEPEKFNYNGDFIDLSKAEGNRALAENCGLVPEAQKGIVDKFMADNQVSPLRNTTPVYMGDHGQKVAFIDNKSGEANCFVERSKVYFGSEARLKYDAASNVQGMKESIAKRVKEYRKSKEPKAKASS